MNHMPLSVQHLTQTCDASPAQWEGTLADGRDLYIRYRWGQLEVRISKSPGADVHEGLCILERQIGHRYDGRITYGEMRRRVSDVLDLPAKEAQL